MIRSYTVLFAIILGVLSIPLIASNFSDQVNWEAMDYLIASGIILSIGSIIIFIRRRFAENTKVLIAAVVIVCILIWMELGVGLFGSPFAGS